MTSEDLKNLAMLLREARLGDALTTGSRFDWDSCDQEEWVRSAQAMLRGAKRFGIKIEASGEPAKDQILASDLYSTIGHNPSTERIIRSADAGWIIVSRVRKTGEEKNILAFDIANAEIDADRVLAGDPSARELPAILTRMAAATLIRKLHAEMSVL